MRMTWLKTLLLFDDINELNGARKSPSAQANASPNRNGAVETLFVIERENCRRKKRRGG